MSLKTVTANDRNQWKAAAATARKRIETRLFIDGRFVPRWKLNNENLLAAMIFDADGTTPPPK